MADKLIYTGATDRARGLSRYQVFRQLPPFLEEMLKENPAIAARFVPLKAFAKRRPPGARVRRPAKASGQSPHQAPTSTPSSPSKSKRK